MQLEDAKRLRERWGNKPCDHPNITKEYYLGTQTGDFVCTRCGKTSSDRNFGKDKKKN